MHIEIEGLRFERAGRFALEIPHLRLQPDRTTAILGPNGAGKTTLLRLIAGLEHPQQGTIRVSGQPIRPDQRPPRDLAYMFQEQVFLGRSVRENLELGLRLRGIRKHERKHRIEEIADLLDITLLLERRADRLSGGEGRRVSLARALCLRASLLLLDEPLAGLDPATYSGLLDELPTLLRASGGATVLVTHDRDEALRLGHDLVVIVGGRILAAGDKRDVVLNPSVPAVAALLGYSVLSADGRRLAVPPGALKLGAGPFEFSMVVDDLLDLVDRREIVGWIANVRVHVTAPMTAGVPQRGDRLLVHADRVWEMS